MNSRIADPNGIEDFARVFPAALFDRLKHGPADEILSGLDVDRYDPTFVFSFELRFQLCPINRLRFAVEGECMTILHLGSPSLLYATMQLLGLSMREIGSALPPWRVAVGITKGQTVTYTLSDGKKIQKVTDVVTGTGSVVRAVSFQHR